MPKLNILFNCTNLCRKKGKQSASADISIEAQNKSLKKLNYKDIDYFSFNGYKTYAKCVRVIDGDTIVCIFYYKNKLYKYRVRLCNIRCGSLKSKNNEEKEIAQKAKEKLTQLIEGKIIYLYCSNWDKYGRLLAYIYEDEKSNKSFNDLLLSEGLGYFYKGGKKKKFEEWFSKN